MRESVRSTVTRYSLQNKKNLLTPLNRAPRSSILAGASRKLLSTEWLPTPKRTWDCAPGVAPYFGVAVMPKRWRRLRIHIDRGSAILIALLSGTTIDAWVYHPEHAIADVAVSAALLVAFIRCWL
jgi:hypothetical protein